MIVNNTLLDSNYDRKSRVSLIILNTPPSEEKLNVFNKLWSISNIKVCADGGANRLYYQLSNGYKLIPDYITGDLDSIDEEVRDFYASKRVNIIKVECQDSTDLEKALNRVKKIEEESNFPFDTVYIYGAFGGRFDHEMGNINCLYKYAGYFKNTVLINETTLG